MNIVSGYSVSINCSQGYRGLGFLDPLIEELQHDDPSRRLTAQQLNIQLKSTIAKLTRFQLDYPLRRRNAQRSYAKDWVKYIFRSLRSVFEIAK